MAGPPHPAGPWVAVAAAFVAAGTLAESTVTAWSHLTPSSRVDEVVAVLLSAIGTALATWALLAGGLSLLTRVPGALGRAAGSIARAITPAFARRLLCLSLGAGIGTVALPAPATGLVEMGPTVTVSQALERTIPVDASAEGSRPVTPRAPTPGFVAGDLPHLEPTTEGTPGTVAAPDPGWVPSRPRPSTDPDGARLLSPEPRAALAADDTVTVRRGDTLWSITERHLGADADPTTVADAWPRWYAANRDTIGADPDLILPGTVLVVPDLTDAPRTADR